MRVKEFFSSLLLVTVTLMALAVPGFAQSTFPSFAKTATVTFRYTAGTINNGGHAVTIAAGTGTATTSKADCAAPTFLACNFVYANAAGTVATTVTLTTALASGNTVLALIETDGTGITKITQANQMSTAFTAGPFMQFTDCVASASCAAPVNTTYSMKVAYGSSALASASPSLATITAIAPAFTSTSTMFCTATAVGTTAAIAAGGLAVNLVSTSSFTVTGPNAVTTAFNWVCVGY